MKRMLAVDPGEETGWVLFTDDKILGGGQTPMVHFSADVWDALADNVGPLREGNDEHLRAGITTADNLGPITDLVIEKFALYPWKAAELSWNEMRTSQLIGALKFIAGFHGLTIHTQPASIKEGAVAAGAEELFVRPLRENRHQNDATMHAVYHQQTRRLQSARA